MDTTDARRRADVRAPGKENAPFVPHRRATSLAPGAPSVAAPLAPRRRSLSMDDFQGDMSPRKRARRSLVPGRSILRKSLVGPTAFADDVTFTLGATTQISETFDATDGDARKSLSRRVSFAPTAHLREFSKDDHEDASSEGGPSPSRAPVPGQSTVSGPRALPTSSNAPLSAEEGETSMQLAETSVTAAFGGVFFADQQAGRGNHNDDAGAALMDETQPDFGEESTMDLASADVTAAFARDAAILARPSLAPALWPATRGDADDTGPPTEAIDEDADDVAAALVAPHIEYNVPLGAPGIAPPSVGSDAALSAADVGESDDGEDSAAPADDASLTMELDGGATGLIVDDGFTSRRLSVSGAVRRASLAPGHAALALLEAEDDEDGDDSGQLPARAALAPMAVGASHAASPATDRRSAAARTTSQGRPSASHLASPQPGRSPARPRASLPSPRRATFAAPAAVMQATEPGPGPADGELATAGALDRFLELAGVAFLEGMFDAKRKSLGTTLGEVQTRTAAQRTRVTLTEQVMAATVTLPMLDMYSGMTRELRASLHDAHAFLDGVADGIANGEPPGILAEFDAATADQRAVMSAQLKKFKGLYRTEVRSEWYDYRAACYARPDGFLDGLEGHLQRLEADRSAVARLHADMAGALPALEDRERRLLGDLERERDRQRELAACDQEHLSSLREAVAEQAAQLEEQTREQLGVVQDLDRLNAKLAELAARRSGALRSIEEARRVTEQASGSTAAEAARLAEALHAEQSLQSWRIIEFNDVEIKLSFRDELGVMLQVGGHGHVVAHELALLRVSDGRLDRDDVARAVLAFCVQRLQSDRPPAPTKGDVTHLVRRLAAQWTAARRLAGEVRTLHSRFPLSVHVASPAAAVAAPSAGAAAAEPRTAARSTLRLAARIVCRPVRAIFDVRLEITGEEVLAGDADAAVEGVGCAVDVRLGEVDRDELAYVVRDRVSRGGRGALLEACREAESRYCA